MDRQQIKQSEIIFLHWLSQQNSSQTERIFFCHRLPKMTLSQRKVRRQKVNRATKQTAAVTAIPNKIEDTPKATFATTKEPKFFKKMAEPEASEINALTSLPASFPNP